MEYYFNHWQTSSFLLFYFCRFPSVLLSRSHPLFIYVYYFNSLWKRFIINEQNNFIFVFNFFSFISEKETKTEKKKWMMSIMVVPVQLMLHIWFVLGKRRKLMTLKAQIYFSFVAFCIIYYICSEKKNAKNRSNNLLEFRRTVIRFKFRKWEKEKEKTIIMSLIISVACLTMKIYRHTEKKIENKSNEQRKKNDEK